MNELCCVTPKRKASLLDLPHEILLAIFLGLPLEDLCTLSCVNHALHTIAGDNQLWSPLCNPLWERFEDNQLIETNICWKTRYITWLRKAIAKYQAGPELEGNLDLQTELKFIADTRLKVLVIGDSGVGKTSLMRMWIVRRLTMVKCNIRYDFLTKDVVWNSVVYTVSSPLSLTSECSYAHSCKCGTHMAKNASMLCPLLSFGKVSFLTQSDSHLDT